MGKIKVVMNKPVYLGQAILDLSKTVMHEFHYDCIKQKYLVGHWLCPTPQSALDSLLHGYGFFDLRYQNR